MTAARIVPLELGRLDTDLAELVGTPGRMVIPIAGWVVEHARGNVLFDAGMHPDIRTDRRRLDRLLPTSFVDFPADEELTPRLAGAGFRPGDIDIMVVSHLHFDHAGGAAELPDARLVVQQDEWKAGHHPKLVELGLYAPNEFDVGQDRQLLDGEHDVFGDGSVVCISTPGHTRGHQSLRVQLPSGPVVLTGDCIYYQAMLDEMRTPQHGFDIEAQLASMRRLAALRDHEGCRLIFGHDMEQFRSIPADGLR
jgi:glyoxylase-like metal-dependent hydrolase (beta-lactamase superfamily II)